MQLLVRMRQSGDELPVLLLTARDAVEDRIAGLQGGADDYLVKPFDLGALVARLHALSRRAAGRSVNLIEAGSLAMAPASGQRSEVRRVGQECGSPCRYRWSPSHYKKKILT